MEGKEGIEGEEEGGRRGRREVGRGRRESNVQ